MVKVEHLVVVILAEVAVVLVKLEAQTVILMVVMVLQLL